MNTPDKLLSNTRLSAYLLGFLSFVVFVYVLIALKEILIPITIAIMLTFLFHPLLKYFRKYKIPKSITIIFLFLFLITINYLLVLIIISNVGTFQEKLAVYSANLSIFIQQMLSPFNLSFREFSDMLGIQIHDFEFESIFQRLFETGVITNIFSSVTSLFGDFFISVIFWVFMIMGKEKFDARLKIAFAERGEMISQSVTNIDEQLQSYIFIKTIISLGTGIVTTIILLIYGIDFALIWGLLTFILNYIPNIGSLIATIAPILVAFLEFGLGFNTISLAVLLLITQNVFGNFLEPHYLGRQMDLSPVFVLFSLIFWGWIWGIVGMFLAVPIAACMKILFSNIEPLKPIAIIIGSGATADGPKKKV